MPNMKYTPYIHLLKYATAFDSEKQKEHILNVCVSPPGNVEWIICF